MGTCRGTFLKDDMKIFLHTRITVFPFILMRVSMRQQAQRHHFCPAVCPSSGGVLSKGTQMSSDFLYHISCRGVKNWVIFVEYGTKSLTTFVFF